MAKSEEELKSLLMKVKEENEKVGLMHNIQKTKIMASGSITSWQIDGETAETVSDFIFWGSKIPADGDCSHEIKKCLLLWRKVMSNSLWPHESQHARLSCPSPTPGVHSDSRPSSQWGHPAILCRPLWVPAKCKVLNFCIRVYKSTSWNQDCQEKYQ